MEEEAPPYEQETIEEPTSYPILFGNQLLDKTFFIYPRLMLQQELSVFKKYILLAYYVFFNKEFQCTYDAPNEISADDNDSYYIMVNESIDSMEEIEFLSFCYLFISLINESHDVAVKSYNGSYNESLKERMALCFKTLDIVVDQEDIDHAFKSNHDVTVIDHFYGRCAQGHKNLFKGVIPTNMKNEEIISLMEKLVL